MHIDIDLNNYDVTDSFYNRIASRGIIRHDDKYLLIYSKYGDYKFPGGGMEKGENHIDTLIREVEEETGYRVIKDTIEKLGTVTEKRKGEIKSIMIMDSHYYYCDVEKIPGERNLDDYEAEYGYKVVWTTLGEAISKNKQVKNLDACPWVIRDTKVMEYLNDGYVNIYDMFKCTADKCPYTCCREWKIPVDEDTEKKWKDIIPDCVADREGERVVRLNKTGMCPNLTQNKLCRIVIEHGENFIPYACRTFPREINEYGDHDEYSLTSCCPVVVDLIRDTDKIKLSRQTCTDNERNRNTITEILQNEKYYPEEALKMSFYILLEADEGKSVDFSEDDLIMEIRKIKGDKLETFNECNEIFLDISENYNKQGLYKGFLKDRVSMSENLEMVNRREIETEILSFEKEWKTFDILMKKYLANEVAGNLMLPEYNKEDMVMAMQWIALEYVCIRHSVFLDWAVNGFISYERVRESIVVISRMMGYGTDDIREYLTNSFKSLKWEWGYLALITGERKHNG